MIVWFVLFALLGLAVGSFLNLCIDRLPNDKSIIRPPSHCDACGRQLGVSDLVPVFSYLWLRGRCRYCQAHISLRVPLVELATGSLFPLLYWHYDLELELLFALACTALFILIFVIDLEHELILLDIIFIGIVLALIFAPFRSDLAEPGWDSTKEVLLGGGVGLGIMLTLYLVFLPIGGFGKGDVPLVAFLGLVTGYPLILTGLMLSIVGGGMVALLLMAAGLKKRRDPIPYGPFLTTGAFIALLWGQSIADWYLGLFPNL